MLDKGLTLKQSLKSYNTFHVESYTSKLKIIESEKDIEDLISSCSFDPSAFLFLGAGSNVLFLNDAPELVVAMRMQGTSYQVNDDIQVIATVAAGVNWHELVKDSLSRGFYGLENLALIPGLVGAAPIQNIGAYGVELCDRFLSLVAIDMTNGKKKLFTKKECEFAYRDSFFKHKDGKNYLVISVKLQLSTIPSANIKYRALSETFSCQTTITPNMVFEEVCKIRRNKLPDPEVLGNAGSFFKNPVVSEEQYQSIKMKFPDLIAYPQLNSTWKLAAGWMIDKAGLKGYRQGDVGVHKEQALVLVNYAAASGDDIAKLAFYVQRLIEEKYSVSLEPEVTILNTSGIVPLKEFS
ncbi:MAG: UDP-N-acetylmuramate dehydrogenase [Enterobacterales bacterium]